MLDGIDDEVKSLAWKFLFQFYSFNSTPRERLLKYKEKYVEYFLMKRKWNQIMEAVDNEKNDSIKNCKLSLFKHANFHFLIIYLY